MQHVIIIGSTKCATTSLYRTMIQHPNICECKFKEPHWFSKTIPTGLKPKVPEDFTYKKFWPKYDDNIHKYALESSTTYSRGRDPGLAERMFEEVPDAKLIHIRRNPDERKASHKRMHNNWGQKLWPEEWYDLVSDYEARLKPFRNLYPEESFLFLEFETITQPDWTLESVWDFLELDHYPLKLLHENKTQR